MLHKGIDLAGEASYVVKRTAPNSFPGNDAEEAFFTHGHGSAIGARWGTQHRGAP